MLSAIFANNSRKKNSNHTIHSFIQPVYIYGNASCAHFDASQSSLFQSEAAIGTYLCPAHAFFTCQNQFFEDNSKSKLLRPYVSSYHLYKHASFAHFATIRSSLSQSEAEIHIFARVCQ